MINRVVFLCAVQDQRVPADMILLRTTEKQGSCFIRTDQLDGETDWKLRLAIPALQQLQSDLVALLLSLNRFCVLL